MAGTGDPTLDFLRDLDDPTKFVAVRGVPVMKPHERKVPAREYGGKKYPARTVVVTEADLPAIVAKMRATEASGTLGRGTPGHVIPGADETTQPPVWAYYRNPRVGVFGPKGEPAVLVDEYRKVGYATEIAENFPYRSSDYYPDVTEVFGVALLKQRPALDLGVVGYSSDRGVCIQYGDIDMPAAPMGPNNAAPPAPVTPGQPAAPVAGQCSPEEAAQYKRAAEWLVANGYCQAPAAKPTEPAPDAKPEPDDKPKEPPVANANPADVIQYQKQVTDLTAELAATKAAAAKAQTDADTAACRVVLYSLQAEGFQFSREQFEKETGKLVKLAPADRTERAAELRLMYARQQVPGGGRVELYQDANDPQHAPAPNPNDPHAAPAHHERAMAIMYQHPGMSYGAAETLALTELAKK